MTDKTELNEISKTTLKSYIQKATTDVHNQAFKAGEAWKDKDIAGATPKLAKSIGRQQGIKKATEKLVKEDEDLTLESLEIFTEDELNEALRIVQGKNYGGSASKDDSDEDEDDKKPTAGVKRGRGRPAKETQPTAGMHGKGLKNTDFGRKWGGYAESVEIKKVGNVYEASIKIGEDTHTFQAITENYLLKTLDTFLESVTEEVKDVDLDAVKSAIKNITK